MVGIRARDPPPVPDAAPRTPGLITGPAYLSGMELDERPLVAASGVGVTLGISAVILGSTPVATAGVVLIILSVISFLLAVGVYFEEPESVEPG